MTTSPSEAQQHCEALNALKKRAKPNEREAIDYALEVIQTVFMGQVFIRVPGGGARKSNPQEVMP